MPSNIPGTPEGRAGIWLIDANTAEWIIHETPGSTLHNFIDGGMAMLGADWEKEAAIGLVHTEGKRIALVFPPNGTMKHQLVVLDDEKKWMFDVGEIDEKRMKVKAKVEAANLPAGRVIFRWTPQPQDNITGIDDVPLEYAVVQEPKAPGGIVIHGKHKNGEWIANWQARHLVKKLLDMLMRVHLQHDEPCRPDRNGHCQGHDCGEPCVLAEIKAGLEAVELPI